MAQDLGISEGVAGQSVTVTALWQCLPVCLLPRQFRPLTAARCYFVCRFADALLLAGFLCYSFSLLLIGRACLGLALGGFGRCRRR